ncbi:hypothetical protein V2A85_16900 [Yersinia sp. 1252 StPb PI]|uniref:glycine-rich domain-containing protein n=1 Tax=Yersinia sp. 1252 StPb PI TaxID=3117404 RepID=UPI003B2802E3
MHRIDTPSAQIDKFGTGKNGFTRGNPQTGVQATALDDDYFDAVQEEIAGVIEGAGIALDKSNRAQLITALKKLFLLSGNNLSEIKDAGAAAVTAALANLSLTTLGIGLPSMTVIPNFDFQNFAFTSGANYLASSSDWINVPSGVSYPTGLYISITVDYATGTQIGLTIKPSTVSSTNFKIFDVRSGGYAGSRTFTVREVQTVDSGGFAGRLMGTPKIFNSSALYTPTAGCKLAIAEIVAAGGGGGGCYLADATGASAGGGGGSGGYSLLIVNNPVATTITIGTGGAMGVVAANSSPAAGSAGGDTTFGSLATAKGGRGGLSAGWAVAVGTVDTACSNGGGGGVVGTGLITSAGDQGGLGIQLKLNGTGGIGGSSKLGSGGHYVGTGYTITLPTKGGGGVGNYRAAGTTYAGSNGADGYCVVWEYF